MAQLERVAQRQAGVFSRSQALRLGVDVAVMHRRLLDAEWLEVQPGVLMAMTTPWSPLVDAWAHVLSIGGPIALTGRFAAACVGLERAPSYLAPEFVIPDNRAGVHRPDAVVHRVRRDTWRTWSHRGLPIAPIPSVIRQLAATSPYVVTRDVVQHALRRNRVSFDLLASQLGRGLSGAAALRKVLEEVAPGYHVMWERRLHRALLRAGVRLTPQVSVAAPDGRKAVLDLGDPVLKFGVEIDGFLNHMARFAADRQRARRLALQCEWTVAPVAVSEIADDLDAVVAEIAGYVRRLRRARAA